MARERSIHTFFECKSVVTKLTAVPAGSKNLFSRRVIYLFLLGRYVSLARAAVGGRERKAEADGQQEEAYGDGHCCQGEMRALNHVYSL